MSLVDTTRQILATVERMFDARLGPVQKRLDAIETRVAEPGPQGPMGEPGPRGERGEPGPAGKDGAVGQKGEKGEPGPTGKDGVDGQRGEKGEKGDPGAAGKDGPQGMRGEKGDRGEKGEPGIQGETGLRGERGLEGQPGRDGRDGQPGPRGEKGDAGRDGKDGLVTLDALKAEAKATREELIEWEQSRYLGVHQSGKKYVRGQWVTYGGAVWHCNRETTAQPGKSDDWTLAVKSGRDGRDK